MDINKQLDFLIEQLEKAKLIQDGTSVTPLFVIATKGDLPGSIKSFELLKQETQYPIFPISVKNPESLEALKDKMFSMLNIVRVYTKPPGKPADEDKPFTLPKGATVGDLAESIHSKIFKYFKYARIWGTSSDHPGQKVGIDHELNDADIVEINVSK